MNEPFWVAGALLAALCAYTLTGGADFGAGVWDLLARGPRRQRQREVIARAIAPIWEANHVWLIVVVVLLFVAFPRAFAAVSTALHIPLLVMLIGVVLRGAAFTFRAYGKPTPHIITASPSPHVAIDRCTPSPSPASAAPAISGRARSRCSPRSTSSTTASRNASAGA